MINGLYVDTSVGLHREVSGAVLLKDTLGIVCVKITSAATDTIEAIAISPTIVERRYHFVFLLAMRNFIIVDMIFPDPMKPFLRKWVSS